MNTYAIHEINGLTRTYITNVDAENRTEARKKMVNIIPEYRETKLYKLTRYEADQIEFNLCPPDQRSKYSLQIEDGTGNKTKWLSITPEELTEIKLLLNK